MKKIKYIILLIVFMFVFSGCLGGDPKKPDTKADFSVQVSDYLGIDKSVDLKAVDSNGNEVSVTWSIDDETVASIEGNKLTGLSSGLVTVVATKDGKSAEAYVVVDEVKKVTQKFELNGGTVDNIPTEYYATQGFVLPIPVREGYNFLGWYSNATFSGNKIDVITSKYSQVSTLYACWHSVEFEIKYVLTTDEGEEIITESDLFNNDYSLYTPEYNQNEKVFSGWYKEAKLFTKVEYIAKGTNEDVVLYGVLVNKSNKIEINLSAKDAVYPASVKNNKIEINVGSDQLPSPTKENYTFAGWYLDTKYTIPVTNLYTSCYIYGKFVETYPVDSINVTNAVSELQRKEELQIKYSLSPSNASVKDVSYESSDDTIAKIDKNGLITALQVGMVTFTIKSKSESGAQAVITMEIYDAEYFNVSYDTTSYVEAGQTIKLNAYYNTRNHADVKLVWKSDNKNVATVSNGVVTGVAAGYTKIRVSCENDSSKYFDFGVTVFDNTTSEVSKFVIRSNSNNIYTTYQLGIGAGGPAYYTDVIGSVSKILFKDYVVDTSYEAVQAGISSNHGGKKTSTEYVCVHYTGNMAKGATGKGNAGYFAGGGNGTSIHYVTGNDGIWSCLDDDLIGYHAGDSTGPNSEAAWYPTGVMYKEGDSIYPTWGISANSKYTLNGQETIIDVPAGSTTQTLKVTEDKWINNMGFGYKIVNGEYYMGKTWWCYTQVGEGRLCNKGGNMNSVGIESAVNEGSDLWYTWQVTAQLVAHLMIKYNLPIQRVVGHHFYSAKNCPQPMLENNMEIWWEFIELVKAEYEHFSKYANYGFKMEVVDGVIGNYGRMTDAKEYKIVTYKVTITKPDKSVETVTLSSIVKGQYSI